LGLKGRAWNQTAKIRNASMSRLTRSLWNGNPSWRFTLPRYADRPASLDASPIPVVHWHVIERRVADSETGDEPQTGQDAQKVDLVGTIDDAFFDPE
jgi:hypothetical protein